MEDPIPDRNRGAQGNPRDARVDCPECVQCWASCSASRLRAEYLAHAAPWRGLVARERQNYCARHLAEQYPVERARRGPCRTRPVPSTPHMRAGFGERTEAMAARSTLVPKAMVTRFGYWRPWSSHAM